MILFITSTAEDYLSDSLLLGLRRLFGRDVVDFPRKDILYHDCPFEIRSSVRGGGFTLYSDPFRIDGIDRSGVEERLAVGGFDGVIFGSIWRQFEVFARWRTYLTSRNTVLVDGEDTPQVYPHAGLWWRRPRYWLLPRATNGFIYFKREWTEDSRFNLWHRFLPRAVRRLLPYYRGLRPISFAIPEEKIVAVPPLKTKDFPRHIVDAEVADGIPGSSTGYAFVTETEYYADLQASRFGITTKRSGWDCLRHYEIAANGAVPCFRDLDSKPATCAPHGLKPGKNCISYHSADELFELVNTIGPSSYSELQKGAMAWIRSKTTQQVAAQVIGSLTQNLWTGNG